MFIKLPIYAWKVEPHTAVPTLANITQTSVFKYSCKSFANSAPQEIPVHTEIDPFILTPGFKRLGYYLTFYLITLNGWLTLSSVFPLPELPAVMVPDPSRSPRAVQVWLILPPGMTFPALTALPGLRFLSRLFGLTLNESWVAVIVEPPVLVKVTVNDTLSPRSIEEGALIKTEPCAGVVLLTETVTSAVADPPEPVAVSV